MLATDTETSQAVDFDKIKQSRVKKFIHHFGLGSAARFNSMKPVCFMSNEVKYKRHFKSYLIKQNIATVWNTYKTINHKEAWTGKMVSFGLQFSRKSRSFHYIDDHYAGMEKGQVIILNLKFLFGLLNIAVAHEISEMNEDKMMVKLCYMENGVTQGSQWISLRETKDGFTEVLHKTLYKSKSTFRDSALYPRLHSKAIKEFHDNVKKKAEAMLIIQ